MKSEIIEIDWSWDQSIVQDILLKYYRDWLFVTPEIAHKTVERILSISKIQPPDKKGTQKIYFPGHLVENKSPFSH